MKIQIRMSIDGDDQWTELGDGFGLTKGESHEFTVQFEDDEEKTMAVASVLQRLVRSLHAPRQLLILAYLTDSLAAYEDMDGSESKLAEAAIGVIDHYKALDAIVRK